MVAPLVDNLTAGAPMVLRWCPNGAGTESDAHDNLCQIVLIHDGLPERAGSASDRSAIALSMITSLAFSLIM